MRPDIFSRCGWAILVLIGCLLLGCLLEAVLDPDALQRSIAASAYGQAW